MDDMSCDTVKKIIPDLRKLGVDEVHLTGGEPLVNSELFNIIELLSKENFVVRMQSNGMLATEINVKKLKGVGLKSILISVDGLEENHNWLRNNPNSYKKAIEAIKNCKKVGLYCRANTVLHKKNLNDIFGTLKTTMDLSADQHSFFYLTPGGRGKDLKNHTLTLKEWQNAEKTIMVACDILNCKRKVKFQSLIVNSEEINECRILDRDNCLLLSDGNVYPCVFFANSQYSLGNIKNDSLLNIWNSDDNWQKYRTSSNKSCSSSKCDGGCKGLSFLLNGSMSLCDPRCQHKINLIPGCIRKYVSE
jgi:radical SAM protein with 4Fe4S-binding SPASM domain